MNWRKLGIFLLMLVFAATMVVGCGDSQDNDAQAPDQSQQENLRSVSFTSGLLGMLDGLLPTIKAKVFGRTDSGY